MRRKKKIGLISLLILVCIFTLSACSKNKLSDEFDQGKVEEAAKSIVDMVNKGDAEGIQELSNEQMKQAMTEDVLSQVFDAVKQFGEYKEITKIDLTGVEDKSSGQSIAVAVVKAKYAEKDVIYTISFDTDMKLVGLYLK